jgi:hypothetical protein
MSNRLKRLEKELASIRRRADNLHDEFVGADNEDDRIDILEALSLVEEEEHRIEIQIEQEKELQSAKE